MNIQDQVLLHLSLINGIGPAAVRAVAKNIDTQDMWQDLYFYSVRDFVARCGVSVSIATKIVQGLSDTQKLEHELNLLERYSISWISYVDPEYPALLKEIYLPPIGLYVQGQIDVLQRQSLAAIGSRNADSYGKQIVDLLVPQLVQHGWAIVSGGALGADAMAHRATLKAGGSTIAVIGSGLLRPYPAAHKNLFESIVQRNGCLISPFPLMMEAFPGNFPARNRIISGMARGCLVIQAAQQSGASITAKYALEQGRDVFAVPGAITNELSKGCHWLLREGAILVGDADDILVHYGQQKNAEIEPETEEIVLPPAAQVSNLVEMSIQDLILATCGEPSSIDDLLACTGCNLIDLQNILFDLQLQGRISQNFMGLWQRT